MEHPFIAVFKTANKLQANCKFTTNKTKEQVCFASQSYANMIHPTCVRACVRTWYENDLKHLTANRYVGKQAVIEIA